MLGSGARADGLGSEGLLLPLDGGTAWPPIDCPALPASCLEQKGAPTNTDSCSVALEPRRVWASSRPAGAEPGNRNIRAGHWAPANDAWRRDGEPERTQPSAPQ